MIFLHKKITVEKDIHAQQRKAINPNSTDTKEKYSARKCIMYPGNLVRRFT